MTSDESPGGREDRSDQRDGHGDRIGIGGGDDSVTRIQLAARWSEAYSPSSDTLGGILKRFRAAYEYLDAVTHGIEPAEVETEVASIPPAPPEPAASSSSSSAAMTPAAPPPQPTQPPPTPWS